jgi:serine/threonine protein kinase
VTSAQGHLPVGHLVANRFQVAAFLGAGEMGEVYDVRDTNTGYAYALKLFGGQVLKVPEAFALFEREARRASDLNVEAIAKAFEFGIEPSVNLPYVLGEFVLLPTLHQVVTTQGTLSIPGVEALLRSIAPPMDAAHAAGVVHRALKPRNLFVSHQDGASWQVRIGDFGIGSLRAVAPPAPGWTATPGWLSAEQADPSTRPAPTMDIYGLGLIAFFALTGRSPFRACQTEPPELTQLWSEMTAPLPPASVRAREMGATLSPTLDPWFARALAVSASQRFKTVSEMAQALWSLIGSSRHVSTMRPLAGAGAQGAVLPPPVLPPPVLPPPVLPPPVLPPPGGGRRQTLLWGEEVDPLASPGTDPSWSGVGIAGQVQREAVAAAPGTALPSASGGFVPSRPGTLPHFDASTDDADDEMPTRAVPGRDGFDPVDLVAAEAAQSRAQDVRVEHNPLPAAGQPATGSVVIAAALVPAGGTGRQSLFESRKNLMVPVAIGSALVFTSIVVIVVSLLVARSNNESSVLTVAPPSSSSVAQVQAPPSASSSSPVASNSAASSASVVDAGPPAVSKTTGLAKFSCKPDCDQVKCDGKAVEAGERGVTLEAGKHSCTATKKGYVNKTLNFELKAGEETTKTFTLVKLPYGGGGGGIPVGGGGAKTGGTKNCGTFANPCK